MKYSRVVTLSCTGGRQPANFATAADRRTDLRVFTTSLDEFLPELSKIAAARGWVLREVKPRKQTLEELFVRITSK